MSREEMQKNHMAEMKQLFIEKRERFLENLERQDEDKNPEWPEKYYDDWYTFEVHLGNMLRILMMEQKTLEAQLKIEKDIAILFEQFTVKFVNISGTKAWKKEAYDVHRSSWDWFRNS